MELPETILSQEFPDKPVCVLHIGKTINEQVKHFDVNIWQKVQNAKNTHTSKYSNSKYIEVCSNLSDQYTSTEGYHTLCYKNFTAICKQKNDPKEDEGSSSRNIIKLRSDLKTHDPSITSGGLESKCIFCNTKRKRVSGSFEKLGLYIYCRSLDQGCC